MEMINKWILGTNLPNDTVHCLALVHVEREEGHIFFCTAVYAENKWMPDTCFVKENEIYRILAYSILNPKQIESILDELLIDHFKKMSH